MYTLRGLCLFLVCSGLMACSDGFVSLDSDGGARGDDQEPTFGTEEAVSEAGTVRYVLEWSKADTGDHVETDLGYRVDLHTAYVGMNSVQLIPCDTETTFGWSWLIPEAIAGHPGIAHSSGFGQGALESISPGASLFLPDVVDAKGTVCEAHILYAETPEFAVDVRKDLVGLSVLLEGVWYSDWGTSADFRLVSSLAHGAILPLSTEPVDLTEEGLQVHFIRTMEGLLDGMDFTTMSDENLSKKFLLNLVANTRVESAILGAEIPTER